MPEPVTPQPMPMPDPVTPQTVTPQPLPMPEPVTPQPRSIHHFPGLDTLAQLQLDVFWGQRHALDVAFGGGGGVGGGYGIRKPITPTLLAEKLFRSGRRDVRRK